MGSAANLIAGFEGFRPSPYWDVNALRAGYGSDTVTLADGRVVPVTKGTTVSRDDAMRDLDRRISTEFEPSAASAVGPDAWGRLSDDQRAVLASLAYNYGAGAWSDDLARVASAVRSGDAQAASAAIAALGSHNGGVNRSRREKEASIFSSGGGNNHYASQPSSAGEQKNQLILADQRIDPAAFQLPRNLLQSAPIDTARQNYLTRYLNG